MVKLYYATGTDINNDGTEDYTEVTGFKDAGTSWALVTANLPVSNVDNLKLRWTYTSSFLAILGFTNYAVDDLKIEADPDPENTPLPIYLLSFTGSFKNHKVILNWQTATEEKNDRFEIQRSFDKQKFKYVGEVKAQGSGNKLVSYTFTDKEVSGENLYYRLKQIDNDGSENFSPIIKIRCIRSKSNNISLFPNPATNILYVQLPKEMEDDVLIDIMKLNGLVVKRILTGEPYIINVEDLAPGIYLVKASGRENSYTAKFLKQ